MPPVLPKAIKKIAVLRAGALGDFLISTPALKALNQAFPEAEITLLTRPSLVEFISQRYAYIHRVTGIPFYPGIIDPPGDYNVQETEGFFDRMRNEKFDLAIQMHGGGKFSNPFVKNLGARLTLGAQTPDAPSLDLNLHYELYQNEIIRNLEMLSLVGVKPTGFQPEAFVLNSDLMDLKATINQFCKDRFRTCPYLENYLVLHPTATDPRRHWPAENFAQVADDLFHSFNLRAVLIGTKEEEKVVEKVERAMKTSPLNLCGRTSLSVLTALISQATLFLGNDSGPSHLAVALNIPTVTVFWIGNMITWAPFFRQIHRPVISWQVRCPICNRLQCRHKVSFVKDVPLAEVLSQAQSLLKSHNY